MRVVVTRPESEAQSWIDALRAHGFDVVGLPLIRIEAPVDRAPVHAAWAHLADCRAAMFVSGNAVRHFFAANEAQAQWPATARAWATGPGTRQALIDAGVAETLVDSPASSAPQFDSEALWQLVEHQVGRGDKLLIVRGGEAGAEGPSGRDWLAEKLSAAGADVDEVVAYVRGAPVWTAAQQAQAASLTENGVWLFSSSQAIANLQRLLPQADWSRAKAVATHPRIAQTARQARFGVVCESRPAVDAVTAALESFR